MPDLLKISEKGRKHITTYIMLNIILVDDTII